MLVDAIKQVLTDEASAPLPFNTNPLARLLETIPGSAHRYSAVVPPNTPRTAPLGSMATGEAKEPIGLIAPSPIDPSAYADWTSAAANHHLPDSAQTKPIPGSAPSEPVTMDHLKELFMALLERKLQPPTPIVLAPEDAEDAAAQAAAEGPGARFKRVMEMYAPSDIAGDI